MSSEEEEESSPPSPVPDTLGEADEDTLRIMLSTDNHLGYCERDPVRGLDSFAAFEEVLSLAREKQVCPPQSDFSDNNAAQSPH